MHKQSQEADSTYRSFMQESIQNLLILKTFCLEKNNLSKLTELQNNKIKLSLKRSSISIVANIFMSIGSWIGFFLVFCWGAVNLSKGIGTYGTLTALLQLVSSIQAPFFGLAGSLPQLAGAIGSAERLIEIEKMTLEDLDYEEADESLLNINNPNIEFEDVSFSYFKNSPVLKNISFNIKSGETIGVMGASGEGKTTIIRLILSLIDSNQGNISIINDNKRYSINPSSRNLISYVPQGNTLFSGTIRQNLLYGNKDASETDIESAITAAGAFNFVDSLKGKLDTVIGEKGVGLSEGQAQRLAIARALLRKRPILILDEATSSLDIETELRVLNTVQNLQHNPTCIIITHRTSALSICDRLFKIENGFLKEVTNYPKAESAASAIQ
jgi:ATP-binding cassette subfamily C protein